ncbi:MAG: hypothetical protein K6E64_09245 [Lachnospiraceae bacterium]|nr:hypothetical protein [Lachnospiraceae bacterium]
MDKKNFLSKEQIFIYLGVALLYALGIVFFFILILGVDLYHTDLSAWISLYSVITAGVWSYFICKKLP